MHMQRGLPHAVQCDAQVPLSDVVPDNQIRNATRTLEDLDR